MVSARVGFGCAECGANPFGRVHWARMDAYTQLDIPQQKEEGETRARRHVCDGMELSVCVWKERKKKSGGRNKRTTRTRREDGLVASG